MIFLVEKTVILSQMTFIRLFTSVLHSYLQKV